MTSRARVPLFPPTTYVCQETRDEIVVTDGVKVERSFVGLADDGLTSWKTRVRAEKFFAGFADGGPLGVTTTWTAAREDAAVFGASSEVVKMLGLAGMLEDEVLGYEHMRVRLTRLLSTIFSLSAAILVAAYVLGCT